MKKTTSICDCGCGQVTSPGKLRIRGHHSKRKPATIAQTIRRFFRYVRKQEDGCWIWTGGKSGSRCPYGAFRAHGHQIRAHIWSYWTFREEITDGMCVCHSCDVYGCVNPDHLWLGTKADNNMDRDMKGRTVHVVGSSHHAAKLDEKDVRDIRVRLSRGESLSVVSRTFGVSRCTISDIKAGRTWTHVS